MKPALVFLSLIIPAYNEELRILTMLKETTDFLKKKSALNKDFTYEIIVVDDGSRDNT
jgi:dolichyl-phosphate beta-glucosyltransferase